jgi:gamma-glutamyl phosphate reductase
MFRNLLKNAKAAEVHLLTLESSTKSRILAEMAQAILEKKHFIMEENLKDIRLAKKIILIPFL